VKLKSAIITLKSDTPFPARPDHLRGFIGSAYGEYTVLHQHEGNGVMYRYPLVRYFVRGGEAIIVGYEEGVEALMKIYPQLLAVKMGYTDYRVYDRSLKVGSVEFGLATKNLTYRFVSPWLALSQENYLRFTGSSDADKSELLSRILIGNLISAAKGFSYTVPDRIMVKLNRLFPVQCRLKGVPVVGFRGSFNVNFTLPDLFGLGKSVSRGFGLVRPVKEGD